MGYFFAVGGREYQPERGTAGDRKCQEIGGRMDSTVNRASRGNQFFLKMEGK